MLSLSAFAQLNKFYTLSKSEDFDTVNFYLKAASANCLIKKSNSESDPLDIYGNPNLEKINPSFDTKINNNTCYARLVLDEYNSSGLGNSLSMAVLKSHEEHDLWRVNFSDNKIYDLSLFYGLGNADINLTGTPVKKLKIQTGSADIIVGYDGYTHNPVPMDTFLIKADFGSIVTKHMELARAKHVITQVGFGSVLLDFNPFSSEKCNIDASVGAGTLEILLPKRGTPVIIYLKDSPLCAVKMADGFEEVEKNIFVNMIYTAHAGNLLSFRVDVALGTVHFTYSD
ncbi:MAG: hypothetical protein OXH57_04305 [Ekhidna sp.]|nr:hypothetical protein [Ekhidna sp.]